MGIQNILFEFCQRKRQFLFLSFYLFSLILKGDLDLFTLFLPLKSITTAFHVFQ